MLFNSHTNLASSFFWPFCVQLHVWSLSSLHLLSTSSTQNQPSLMSLSVLFPSLLLLVILRVLFPFCSKCLSRCSPVLFFFSLFGSFSDCSVHNSLQFEAALGGGGVMLRQKGNELLQQAQDMRHVEVQFLMGFCMCVWFNCFILSGRFVSHGNRDSPLLGDFKVSCPVQAAFGQCCDGGRHPVTACPIWCCWVQF